MKKTSNLRFSVMLALCVCLILSIGVVFEFLPEILMDYGYQISEGLFINLIFIALVVAFGISVKVMSPFIQFKNQQTPPREEWGEGGNK